MSQVTPPTGKRQVTTCFELGDEILLEVGEHNVITEYVGVDDHRIGESIPSGLNVWRTLEGPEAQ